MPNVGDFIPRPPLKGFPTPRGIVSSLEERETREEMKTLAEKLNHLPPEAQVTEVVGAKLSLDEFRVLLTYWKPFDWVVERIRGRLKRLEGWKPPLPPKAIEEAREAKAIAKGLEALRKKWKPLG